MVKDVPTVTPVTSSVPTAVPHHNAECLIAERELGAVFFAYAVKEVGSQEWDIFTTITQCGQPQINNV